MSIWKSLFKTVAGTAIVTGLFKGAGALNDTYGVTAKMRIAHGKVEVSKGFFSTRAQSGVQGVVSDLSIGSGWIEVRKDGKVAFSGEFPESVRQRLRNIIQNA